MTMRFLAATAVVSIALGLAPSFAAAQTPTLRACYVPGSGTVYRIGAEGTPAACHSPKHVEFSWAATQPAGRCPAGQAVVGIGADGSLLCEAVGSPEPSPVNAFVGEYGLATPLQTTCTDSEYASSYEAVWISAGPTASEIGIDLRDDEGFNLPWITTIGWYGTFDPDTDSFVLDREGLVLDGDADVFIEGGFPSNGTIEMTIEMTFNVNGVVCTTTGSTSGIGL